MILSITLIVRVWTQRQSSGRSATLIAALMIAVLWWTACYAFEIITPINELKLLSNSLKFVGVVFVPVFWLLFALQYTGRTAWLVLNRILLLCFIPFVTIGLIATNAYHQLFWQNMGIINLGDYSVTDAIYGIWFWVHSLYSYALIMSASYFLFRQFVGSPTLYRRQLVALLVAFAAPMIANAITIFGNQILDITPISFTITGLALTWGLLRFQLLNLVPIARNIIVESMGDGVLVLDAHDRIIDINPAAKQVINAQTSDPIGKSVAEVIDLVTERPDLTAQIRASGGWQNEIEIMRKNDKYVLDVRISPLYDRNHQVSGRIIIFRDITDRKRAEQQIRSQNDELIAVNHELVEARKQAEYLTQLKSQFLATMSHELRTPLNAVIGYTEIQLAGMTGTLTDEQNDYQERVLANAIHLLGLINDVLDLSKIEAGRMDLIQKSFNLKKWLDEIVIQNRVLAEKKQLRFEVSLDPQLPETVVADPERLKQVVINLLSNASKFTDTGYVKIELARNDADTWKISVSDSGLGIPSHAQETIFEEFRQVDGSTRRQHGGTGLGLAIVRKLVLMMGGNIRLKSEVGAGSTFTIIMPYLADPARSAVSAVAIGMGEETV
ncbi:MAG: PAS domain-containing protein [Chloroflexi bacterium]|nr:PAS domain-containing protein [Chloroflexota bacterium]MCC6895683.1 PAS domain-containing protein [Anaerolineae bacterium]